MDTAPPSAADSASASASSDGILNRCLFVLFGYGWRRGVRWVECEFTLLNDDGPLAASNLLLRLPSGLTDNSNGPDQSGWSALGVCRPLALLCRGPIRSRPWVRGWLAGRIIIIRGANARAWAASASSSSLDAPEAATVA